MRGATFNINCLMYDLYGAAYLCMCRDIAEGLYNHEWVVDVCMHCKDHGPERRAPNSAQYAA